MPAHHPLSLKVTCSEEWTVSHVSPIRQSNLPHPRDRPHIEEWIAFRIGNSLHMNENRTRFPSKLFTLLEVTLLPAFNSLESLPDREAREILRPHRDNAPGPRIGLVRRCYARFFRPLPEGRRVRPGPSPQMSSPQMPDLPYLQASLHGNLISPASVGHPNRFPTCRYMETRLMLPQALLLPVRKHAGRPARPTPPKSA